MWSSNAPNELASNTSNCAPEEAEAAPCFVEALEEDRDDEDPLSELSAIDLLSFFCGEASFGGFVLMEALEEERDDPLSELSELAAAALAHAEATVSAAMARVLVEAAEPTSLATVVLEEAPVETGSKARAFETNEGDDVRFEASERSHATVAAGSELHAMLGESMYGVLADEAVDVILSGDGGAELDDGTPEVEPSSLEPTSESDIGS
jgi:hypothetical protein